MGNITLFFKGRPVHEYVLDDNRLKIGRDSSCDIVIDNTQIQPVHAYIIRSGAHRFIQPATPDNELLVNHQQVSKHLLIHGDKIQFGDYSLAFVEKAVALDFQKAAKNSRNSTTNKQLDQLVGNLNILPQSCLQIISGEHVGKTIPLYRSLLRLGLSSNQCAMIAHRSDGFYLTHLEGDVSPVVDGEKIDEKSILLSDGSIIEIGKIRLRFHEESVKAAAM